MMALLIRLVSFASFCLCVSGNIPLGFSASFEEPTHQSYYFFSHDAETWTGALVSCQILGGYLVEIDSQKEYEFLREASRNNEGISRWVGLSDKRQIDVWEWATSHNVYNETEFNMWASGEPDQYIGQKDESCVLLDKFNGDNKVHDYQLADVLCERRQKYICEYNPPEIPRLSVGK